MNILVTTEQGIMRDVHFPEGVLTRLNSLGNVSYNESEKPFTQEQLIARIEDIDICITHWASPEFMPEVLTHAKRLKLITHAAASVGNLVNDAVYKSGIKVSSANMIMARFVAEGVLAYILAGLRMIPQHDADMKNGSWNRRIVESHSLLGSRVGLVGLGTTGRYLLELLRAFDVKVRIYDPYLAADALPDHPDITLDSLENVLAWADVVSVHASLTPETYHMLNEDKLSLLQDHALFVNTARGKIVDEQALIRRLQQGTLRAVLDVFQQEPLAVDSPLRMLENVILIPHMAGLTAKEAMTHGMIDEIERFIAGKPLAYEIPYRQFSLMTRLVNL